MPNPENLKSYKKGQSGNPKGKPKGRKNMSTILREIAETCKAPDAVKKEIAKLGYKGKLNIAQAIAFMNAAKSLKGDVQAMRLFMEYYDGQKLSQETKLTGDIEITQKESITEKLVGKLEDNRKKYNAKSAKKKKK